MARREKTSPAEDIMDLVAMLPWWVCVALALVSYLLLHSVASRQVVANAQPGQVGEMRVVSCFVSVQKGPSGTSGDASSLPIG